MPRISVEVVVESPPDPGRPGVLLADVDRVLDTTGDDAATLAASVRRSGCELPQPAEYLGADLCRQLE